MSLAEKYETFLVPIIMNTWAEKMARLVEPGDRVLDIGCGTGIVSRHAAPRAGMNSRIVGLDMNQEMLAVARRASLPPGIRIDWMEADAAEIPFEAAQFDVALCQFALMFMADKPAVAREMRRMLVPGGRLGLSVFATGPYDQALKRALSNYAQPVETDFSIWNYGDPEWLRMLVEEAGFEISSLKKESIPSQYASLKQAVELMRDWSETVAGLTPEKFDLVCRALEAELGEYITAEGFACPEPVITVTARAL